MSAADKDTFLSTQNRDYKWPYPKTIVPRPSQPPLKTKPLNYFVAVNVQPYCHCDAHLYDPETKRYERLAGKERVLHEELEKLNGEMLILTNQLVDHPCDTDDDKLKTTYEIDYVKRGLSVPQYRKLIPAIESPVGVPVKAQVIGVANGYRDPTSFRYSTFNRPTVDPCRCISFATSPANVDTFFSQLTGRSEYQDTISKMGLSIIKSRQQYSEPLPSSRRRFGEQCL